MNLDYLGTCMCGKILTQGCVHLSHSSEKGHHGQDGSHILGLRSTGPLWHPEPVILTAIFCNTSHNTFSSIALSLMHSPINRAVRFLVLYFSKTEDQVLFFKVVIGEKSGFFMKPFQNSGFFLGAGVNL